MYNFEKLTVWQKAIDFCELIYRETKKFPREEIGKLLHGLINSLKSEN